MNRKKEIKISNYDILSQFSLDGRIALVTGGSGGIGHACVKRLLDYGAKVTLTYIKGTETPEMVLEKFNDADGITIQPFSSIIIFLDIDNVLAPTALLFL